MIENPEYRARLRRKLEKWPNGKGSPITINDGLELLVMVEHQEKTIREWRRRFKNRGRKNKSLKARNSRLEKEADWLAEQILCCTDDNRVDTCNYVECASWCRGATIESWREAARKAGEEKCQTGK